MNAAASAQGIVTFVANFASMIGELVETVRSHPDSDPAVLAAARVLESRLVAAAAAAEGLVVAVAELQKREKN